MATRSARKRNPTMTVWQLTNEMLCARGRKNAVPCLTATEDEDTANDFVGLSCLLEVKTPPKSKKKKFAKSFVHLDFFVAWFIFYICFIATFAIVI